ncbi:hypothetical protein GFL28_25540, partial [Rhizobium leguminosarum bv. viciae]|nr:hypothetical protein [Rhizobium leguminosarum bv. viciae]
VFIKISSIIKPEKILLLKPVNLRGDYPCIGIVVDRSRSADDRAYGEERRGRRQHRQPRRIDRDSLAFSLNGNGALNHHRLEFR